MQKAKPAFRHFSLDGLNCDICTKQEGRIVPLAECAFCALVAAKAMYLKTRIALDQQRAWEERRKQWWDDRAHGVRVVVTAHFDELIPIVENALRWRQVVYELRFGKQPGQREPLGN